MKTTGNLGLKKPDGTDIVDITDLNGNMDILDTAVKAVQDHTADTVKHITATERTAWNAKASTAVATTTVAGLMAGADKSKLDSVAQGANNYVHPSTHSPSVIVQDSSNRFVTDAEKAAWNGKANLVTTPQQTTADVTYFVRTDGNDNNTGLANTVGGAFKSISKALSMIPKLVNHIININIGTGTYNEEIGVSGLSGAGSVSINGGSSSVQDSASYVVTGRIYSMRNSCRVQFYGLRTSYAGAQYPIYVDNSSETFFQFCSTNVNTNPKQFGVFVENAKVFLYSCEFHNKSSAIRAHVNADILVQDCVGQGNDTAHFAAFGGKIHVSGNLTISGTAFTNATEGGIVTTYGHGVINPWGENNGFNRTYISAYMTADQAINASVNTKVLFQGKSIDHLAEFDVANGRFTAGKTGTYLISTQLGFKGLLDQNTADLIIYINGGYQLVSRLAVSGTYSPPQARFVDVLRLNAGDFVEVYVYCGAAFSIEGAAVSSFVRLQRVG